MRLIPIAKLQKKYDIFDRKSTFICKKNCNFAIYWVRIRPRMRHKQISIRFKMRQKRKYTLT